MSERAHLVACEDCGEALVKVTELGDRDQYREFATGEKHECWQFLPEHAEHLRLD